MLGGKVTIHNVKPPNYMKVMQGESKDSYFSKNESSSSSDSSCLSHEDILDHIDISVKPQNQKNSI